MNLETNKIYHADCLEIMQELPDGCIDLVLTDPPYGIFSEKNQTGFLKGGYSKGDPNYGKVHKANEWDKKRPDKIYFDEMFRISKNQVIFGLQYFIDYLKPTKEIVIWDKKRNNYFSDGEAIWTSFKGTLRIYRQGWNGYFKEGEREPLIHPTQKPLNLIIWLIEKYSKEGDIIFDGFAGSGVLGVACSILNRQFICIEKREEYYKAAKKRIEFEQAQLKLF